MTTETKDPTRLKELRVALQERKDTMDRVVGSVTLEEKGVVVNQERADSFRTALAESHEIVAEIKALEGYDEVKAFMSSPAVPSMAAQMAQLQASMSPQEQKSLGQMFLESTDFREFKSQGLREMRSAFQLEATDLGAMSGYGQKDVYFGSGAAQATRGFGTTQFDPLVGREFRQRRVRDLFPVVPTTANLIDYFRVTGFGSGRLDLTSAASTVPDYRTGQFGIKPHSSLNFASDQAPVRTIAHWEAAHRHVIDDEPQMRATIDNELLYGLRLEEDHQILNGTGSNEDLLGILRHPDIQTYTQGSLSHTGETKADAMRRAATRAILAYYEPSGYVIHPYDWEDVELTKTTEGLYVVATNVVVGAQARIWRQPVVDTPAMPQGTFLTGAFGLGAQLYDRMQASVRIAEQHADFFVRNAIVILAEERLALAIKRPESFVRGTFL